MAPVKIHCDIQQMHFQLLAHAGDGRTRADVGHARQRLRPQAVHLHRIHPFHRRHQALERQVGGREADGAAQLIAVHHAPGDAVRVAQQGLCQRQIVLAQRSADRRTADTPVAFAEGRGADHVEAVLFSGLLQ